MYSGCIVNAFVIFHNICNAANLSVPELTQYAIQQETFTEPPLSLDIDRASQPNYDLHVGIATRPCS